VDKGSKTATVDFTSCDATAAANTACSSAGGMSYTIDVACSETSGSGWSIDYSKMPGCAGTSCTINDFNTMLKQHLETAFQNGIKEHAGGTWSCTATANLSSDPSDDSDAILSAVQAILAPSLFMAGSIGEGDGTCATETDQVWQDADLKTALEGLNSCDTNVDKGSKTATVDFTSCDATAAANTACSSAGGMSYTIDVACSETSGSGWSIDYSKMPGCAGTSCTINDFNTMLKQHLETAFQNGIKEHAGGTWSCTATANLSSDPSDDSDAVILAVPAILAPSFFMADSIGEDDGTCLTETGQLMQNVGLNMAIASLDLCEPNVDNGRKTVTVDYPSCDATAAAITACSSAGGMSYTIDVACSETSGNGVVADWSVYYSKIPSCAGTGCTISDFDTMLKQQMETSFQDGIQSYKGGTWSCTATASLSSDPSDEAILSVE